MKYLPVIVFLVLVLLSGTQAPQKIETNLAGLDAMTCLGSTSAEIGLPPFFQAVKSTCLDDFEGGQQAFRDAVAMPDARIRILRAHQPNNLELARWAVENHTSAAAAYFWLGDALLYAERQSEAVQAYENGLRLEGTDADVWDQLGRLYEAQGDLDAAGDAFSQACRYVDHGKNGCVNAGRIYLVLGKLDLAEQRFRDSIIQVPYFERSYRGLVDTLIARAGTPEGLEYVEALASQGDKAAQQALQERGEN